MPVNDPDKILDELTLPGAVIRAKDVKEAGIHGSFLQRMVCEGRIERCGRGLYRRTDVEPDELLVLQIKYSKGVYSNETALFLHHYIDILPDVLTVTFPQGYHAESLNYGNVYAKHIIPSNFNLGVVELKTPQGNKVKAYNIERTLCDLLRGKKENYELFEKAFKKYLEIQEPDIPLLEEYAKKLRVHSKLKPYLESYTSSHKPITKDEFSELDAELEAEKETQEPEKKEDAFEG